MLDVKWEQEADKWQEEQIETKKEVDLNDKLAGKIKGDRREKET